MTDLEILQIEGLVIRKISATTTSRWSWYEGQPVGANEKLVTVQGKPNKVFPDGKRQMIERIDVNSLAGYAITFCGNQDSTIRFYRESTGFGETIGDAYANYLSKRKG